MRIRFLGQDSKPSLTQLNVLRQSTKMLEVQERILIICAISKLFFRFDNVITHNIINLENLKLWAADL